MLDDQADTGLRQHGTHIAATREITLTAIFNSHQYGFPVHSKESVIYARVSFIQINPTKVADMKAAMLAVSNSQIESPALAPTVITMITIPDSGGQRGRGRDSMKLLVRSQGRVRVQGEIGELGVREMRNRGQNPNFPEK